MKNKKGLYKEEMEQVSGGITIDASRRPSAEQLTNLRRLRKIEDIIERRPDLIPNVTRESRILESMSPSTNGFGGEYHPLG